MDTQDGHLYLGQTVRRERGQKSPIIVAIFITLPNAPFAKIHINSQKKFGCLKKLGDFLVEKNDSYGFNLVSFLLLPPGDQIEMKCSCQGHQ